MLFAGKTVTDAAKDLQTYENPFGSTKPLAGEVVHWAKICK
jgi:hypothetical protein